MTDSENQTPVRPVTTVHVPLPLAALHVWLDRGEAAPAGDDATYATPAQLALMFADLAARCATLAGQGFPEDVQLRVRVNFQPVSTAVPNFHEAEQDEARMAVVNYVGEALLPGVRRLRRPFEGAGVMHYEARGRTAAGLNVLAYTSAGLDPEVRQAEQDALAVVRAEAARDRFVRAAEVFGHVPRVQPTGAVGATERPLVAWCICWGMARTEPMTELAAREAWHRHAAEALAGLVPLGHSPRLVPAPKMDTPGLVAVACECGDYRSGPGTSTQARKAWQQHAAARTAEAEGAAS